MDKKNKVLGFIKEHKTEIITAGTVVLTGAALVVLYKKVRSDEGRVLTVPDELKELVTGMWIGSKGDYIMAITPDIPVDAAEVLCEKLKQLPEIDSTGEVQMLMAYKRIK